MEYILDRLMKQLENGNYITALAILFIVLLFKAKDILIFLNLFKSNKLNRLKNLYQIKSLSSINENILKECIEKEIFNEVTGINTEKILREKIVMIHNISQGVLTYKDFQLALPFLKIKDYKLVVSFTKWDILTVYFNIFISIILFSISWYFMSLPSLIGEMPLYKTFFSILIGIIIYAFGGFILSLTFSLRTAKRIQDDIIKLQENQNIRLSNKTE